jgi:hypothetical protein
VALSSRPVERSQEPLLVSCRPNGKSFMAKWQTFLAKHILFLFLYYVWERLYGQEFAEEQVAVEKKRKGVYDYEAAWAWALAQSKEERVQRFKEIVGKNQGGG